MAYRLDLNEDYSIYRSKHTGAIGLWQRNEVYGYYAAIEYLDESQKLTVRKLTEWAVRAGVKPEDAYAKHEAMIRKGGHGMIPVPEFNFPVPVELPL